MFVVYLTDKNNNVSSSKSNSRNMEYIRIITSKEILKFLCSFLIFMGYLTKTKFICSLLIDKLERAKKKERFLI